MFHVQSSLAPCPRTCFCESFHVESYLAPCPHVCFCEAFHFEAYLCPCPRVSVSRFMLSLILLLVLKFVSARRFMLTPSLLLVLKFVSARSFMLSLILLLVSLNLRPVTVYFTPNFLHKSSLYTTTVADPLSVVQTTMHSVLICSVMALSTPAVKIIDLAENQRPL